ncbi:hypothetical protein [Pedobacter endophyticus]|uniref:Uncharacterized protein n=1 Tax=Pedobacter endophyticus TaxID=2789740 RepID=A0A7S9KZS2_9SPHI|nr:hypothetical protein [Pedobacter endophyticus]QPH39868.1 hypothetical protein IZT61_00865 [Pedobacter endophyticus]
MKKDKHLLENSAADYHKAEEDLLKRALSTSYTDRFHAMTRLMKLNIILKSAKVVHKKIDK